MPLAKRVAVHTAAAAAGPLSMALVLLAATATVVFFAGWGAWLVVTYPVRRYARGQRDLSRASSLSRGSNLGRQDGEADGTQG